MNKTHFAFIIFAGITNSALPGNAATNFYTKVEAGDAIAASVGDQGLKFVDSKPKEGATFGMEAGYKVNQNFRVAINVGYQKNKLEKSFSKDSELNYISQLKLGSLSSTNSMVNVYYDIIEYSGITPYITLGAGFSRTKIDTLGLADKTTEIGSSTGKLIDVDSLSYKGASKTNFAWSVGAGGLYKINQKISLDFGYKYKDLGKVTESISFQEANLPKEYTAKLRSHNVTLGVMYNFQ